jgi:hypothetical protein
MAGRFAPVRSSSEAVLEEHQRWMKEHEVSSRTAVLARAEAAALKLAEHKRQLAQQATEAEAAAKHKERLFAAAAKLEAAPRRLVPDKYSVSQQDLHALEDIHTKERCPGCGLWKVKLVACAHCIRQPNRMQAKLAQAKQVAEEIASGKEQFIRQPVGLGRIVMADYRSTSSPAERDIHTKEKCAGCGLWKRKDGRCRLCETRPNRAQARRAQARVRQPPQFYRTVELAPSQARLLAKERVASSAATLASWVSSADRAAHGMAHGVAHGMAHGGASGHASGNLEVGLGDTKSSFAGGAGAGEEGYEAAGSLRRVLSRPMSAPSLVVGPREDELGVPGSVSRRVISSPRGHAGHGAMLELLQYARSLRAKPKSRR